MRGVIQFLFWTAAIILVLTVYGTLANIIGG